MKVIDEIIEKRAKFIEKYVNEPEKVLIPKNKIFTLMTELDGFARVGFLFDTILGMKMGYSENQEIKISAKSGLYLENGKPIELIE